MLKKYKVTKVYSINAESKQEALTAAMAGAEERIEYISVMEQVDKGWMAEVKKQVSGR